MFKKVDISSDLVITTSQLVYPHYPIFDIIVRNEATWDLEIIVLVDETDLMLIFTST